MKKMIVALVIGMMIGSAGTAFAALEGEVTAVFAQFRILINGQEKQLETTPLVYNGTSYLPVRDLANLVGYDVTYKADSRTIELTQPNVTIPASPTVTNTTYSSGNPTVTTTTYNNEKVIGDMIQLTNTQIKINRVGYAQTYDSTIASTGEKFAIISIDIKIDKEPKNGSAWTSNKVLPSFKISSGQTRDASYIFSVGDSSRIKSFEWTSVDLIARLGENETIQTLNLSDPTDFGNTATVILN